MCDHDERLVVGIPEVLDFPEKLLGRPRIQVAGWLVGQHESRLVHERASDRNALLFPSR